MRGAIFHLLEAIIHNFLLIIRSLDRCFKNGEAGYYFFSLKIYATGREKRFCPILKSLDRKMVTGVKFCQVNYLHFILDLLSIARAQDKFFDNEGIIL